MATVRPATRRSRIRAVTFVASRSSSRLITSRSAVSRRERLLGTHAALGVVVAASRGQRAPVGTPGQLVQVRARARPTSIAAGSAAAIARDVADGDQADAVQPGPGLRPDAEQLADVEGVQVADHLGRRHDQHAVRLGPPAGELGDRDGAGQSDRAGDPLLVVDPGPDAARRSVSGVPSATAGTGDVEERLVQ